MLRRLVTALCLGGALLATGAPAQAQEEWRAWPLPVPPGGRFQTPGGIPGDLSFIAPNRGLMTVGGNNSVPEGIWSWDGIQWHQLATVCGAGASARIAWAGPDEFWTIARPSLPRDQQAGLALCHFKGGEVVGSYSALPLSEDPYRELSAAACNGPNDCWFAGVAAQDGTGSRSGGFHLHWDGSSVQTVYSPQGRAVSDLLADGNRFFESTHVAGRPGTRPDTAILREPEVTPRLLHRIEGGAFANDPFVPMTFRGNTDLRALDSDGQTRWVVGGGASFETTVTQRPPLAARLAGSAAEWSELALMGDPMPNDATFGNIVAFGDVAALPGTDEAWATLLAGGGGHGEFLQPAVAHIDAGDRRLRVVRLAGTGEPLKGAATRIDCPASNDCWVATARGYLYRLTSTPPPAYPRDSDPAFQGTITVRPNEAAEQSVPDDPPQDDSLLLAPPVEAASEPTAEQTETCELPKLISRQRSKVRGRKRLRLVVSFRLARQATVGITARRGNKVVARAKPRTLRRGNRSLTLRVTRKRWPKKLSFVIRNDSGAQACAAASSTRTSDR